jgi:cyclophilin family peptidyl-prolyl cis-trans isomerase
MKTSQKITFATLLIMTSIIFSGCTKPGDANNSKDIEVSFDSSKTDSGINLSDTKVTRKDANPQMQEKQYKTIKDFKEIEATQVIFETTKGNLVIDLFRDKAPLTTANFLDLIDSGFYDGIIFHRVIPGFMAQVGDPITKEAGQEHAWGTGGPGYKIMDEFDPTLTHDSAGILSMANAGPNTGGSQIFITYEATPHLDGKHAVFGKLVEGAEVLESIEKGDKIIKATYR